MDWTTLILINLAWVVLLFIMRCRYRKLIGEALDTLDYAHKNLKDGEVRRMVGMRLSDLRIKADIYPWEGRKGGEG